MRRSQEQSPEEGDRQARHADRRHPGPGEPQAAPRRAHGDHREAAAPAPGDRAPFRRARRSTVPEGMYLTAIKETGKKLEIHGVAQSSTRVSTFMRNIDGSTWLTTLSCRWSRSAQSSPTGGSSFTLFANEVGVDLDNGGEAAPKKVAAQMNFLEQLRTLDPRDVGRWPAAVRVLLRRPRLPRADAASAGTCSSGTTTGRCCKRRSRTNSTCARSSSRNSSAPPTSTPTRTSWPRWNAASAPCCASCPARPRCRTCWSTSRRRASLPACRKSSSSRRAEKGNGFYAELPIKIKLVGSYHEFGAFVSGIAALPRIVTLHDITITPVDQAKGDFDNLVMDVTAKTYRYIEDERPQVAEETGRPHVSPLARKAGMLAAALAVLTRRRLFGRRERPAEMDRRRPRSSRAGASSRCPRSSPTRRSCTARPRMRSPFQPAGPEFHQRPGNAPEFAPQRSSSRASRSTR